MKYFNFFSSPIFATLPLRSFVVMVGIILLQLPFLTADADYYLSGSRAPYTDEGLYTAQIRNAIITGRLDLTEMDGVLKEPLFAGGMWLVCYFIDESMLSCRSAVMILVAFLISLFSTGSNAFSRTVLIATPLGFLSFYIFHYSHLAMAEILCALFILAACRLLHTHLSGFRRWWILPASSLLIFAAYASKIQFIYVVPIPPLTILLAIILRLFSGIRPQRTDWIDLLVSILLALAFVMIYFLTWVAPHYELWVKSIFSQFGERTATASDIPTLVYKNLREMLTEGHNWPMLLPLPFGLAVAFREWSISAPKKESRQNWIALMAPLLAWLVVESHKFSLPYLPTRYLVSFYLALIMFVSAGLSMFRRSHFTGAFQVTCIIGAIALTLSLSANAIFYQHSLRDRSYSIRDAQISFANEDKWRGKVVMGGWAPTLFWGTGAITLPVWKDSFNYKNIIATYNPSALVSEIDEKDTHGAFAADGIDLKKLKSKTIRVWKYVIGVYEYPS